MTPPPSIPSAPRDPPPVDFVRLICEFDGDMPLATTMLQSWLDRLPAQRDEIQAALESGDFETLRQRAHAIKGAAANLSAMPLSRAAAELEQAARRADAPACRNLIPAFADLCHQLAVYVVQKSPPNPKEPSP